MSVNCSIFTTKLNYMAKEEIVEISESYIHLRSDEVPEWVKNLDSLKAKIRENILNSNSQNNIEGVTFCHPIDVPSSK
jgi:hypothetical protein